MKICKKIVKLFGFIFIIFALFLFSINIIGLFRSLQNPLIYQQQTGFANDKEIYGEDVNAIADNYDGNVKKYATDLNLAISKAMLHYWENDKASQYNIIIPWWENYVIFLATELGWRAEKYEFCDPNKALERGVGICTQSAMILNSLLNSKGIESKIEAFTEHTVVTAQVEKEKNEWWILDPDYGVVLRANLDEVSQNFDAYKSEYERVINNSPGSEKYKSSLLNRIKNIYMKRDYGSYSIDNYVKNGCEFEKNSYFAKWAIPTLALSLGLILLLISKSLMSSRGHG